MGDETHGMESAPLTERAPSPVLALRYQLLGLIGTGGAGRVYRARDLELDEIVALKTLRPAENRIAALRREVKLARRVTHKHVARTFDIGEHDGEKFLTMEYVEGTSLSAMIAGARVPLQRAVRRTSPTSVWSADKATGQKREVLDHGGALALPKSLVATATGLYWVENGGNRIMRVVK